MRTVRRVLTREAEKYVLVNFFRGVRGLYHIRIPLRSGQRLQLKPAGGSDFEITASSFCTLPDDRDLESQFCDSRQSASSHSMNTRADAARREPSAIRDDFEKLWKTEYWNLA